MLVGGFRLVWFSLVGLGWVGWFGGWIMLGGCLVGGRLSDWVGWTVVGWLGGCLLTCAWLEPG